MVDLPAPFSPQRPRISPKERSIETSFKAFTPGKDFDMPRISRSLDGTANSLRNSPAVGSRTALADVLIQNRSTSGSTSPDQRKLRTLRCVFDSAIRCWHEMRTRARTGCPGQRGSAQDSEPGSREIVCRVREPKPQAVPPLAHRTSAAGPAKTAPRPGLRTWRHYSCGVRGGF